MKKYYFKKILNCEMCGSDVSTHKILGQRLNKSQGFNPKSKTGISVTIVKCSICNLIYSNPQPIPFDLQDHYGEPPEEYWNEQYFKSDDNYFASQIKTAKSFINYKSGMKSLDIGAGIGKGMLSLENAGFDAFGFEPSIPFFNRAISKMKVNKNKIKLGAIEDVDYDNETFNFITFGAVFEHLYTPAKSLEKALKWLKPNGIIHIEVPSSKWFMPSIMNFYFKLIRTNYVTNLSPMHSPFHLHEFDIKSFEKLADKLNFTIEQTSYEVCSIYYVPQFLHPLLRKYMEWTKKGMQLTLYLRKTVE